MACDVVVGVVDAVNVVDVDAVVVFHVRFVCRVVGDMVDIIVGVDAVFIVHVGFVGNVGVDSVAAVAAVVRDRDFVGCCCC